MDEKTCAEIQIGVRSHLLLLLLLLVVVESFNVQRIFAVGRPIICLHLQHDT